MSHNNNNPAFPITGEGVRATGMSTLMYLAAQIAPIFVQQAITITGYPDKDTIERIVVFAKKLIDAVHEEELKSEQWQGY